MRTAATGDRHQLRRDVLGEDHEERRRRRLLDVLQEDGTELVDAVEVLEDEHLAVTLGRRERRLLHDLPWRSERRCDPGAVVGLDDVEVGVGLGQREPTVPLGIVAVAARREEHRGEGLAPRPASPSPMARRAGTSAPAARPRPSAERRRAAVRRHPPKRRCRPGRHRPSLAFTAEASSFAAPRGTCGAASARASSEQGDQPGRGTGSARSARWRRRPRPRRRCRRRPPSGRVLHGLEEEPVVHATVERLAG